jgi:hypothetical protein
MFFTILLPFSSPSYVSEFVLNSFNSLNKCNLRTEGPDLDTPYHLLTKSLSRITRGLDENINERAYASTECLWWERIKTFHNYLMFYALLPVWWKYWWSYNWLRENDWFLCLGLLEHFSKNTFANDKSFDITFYLNVYLPFCLFSIIRLFNV